MSLVLSPCPRLRAYVSSLWVGTRPVAAGRERVLPSGGMHLAIRLRGGPVRIYDGAGAERPQSVATALVAGVRTTPYWKDADAATHTIGVQLRPGAAIALFGVSAAELVERHVGLDGLWGTGGGRLRDALLDATDSCARLALLETALLQRLRPRGMHPAVARALERMHAAPSAARLPDVDGISQRHFIARFRDATGLSPKRYARLHRFGRLVQGLQAGDGRRLSELALAAGYSDQAHCSREFREFAGISPQAWRRERGSKA